MCKQQAKDGRWCLTEEVCNGVLLKDCVFALRQWDQYTQVCVLHHCSLWNSCERVLLIAELVVVSDEVVEVTVLWECPSFQNGLLIAELVVISDELVQVIVLWECPTHASRMVCIMHFRVAFWYYGVDTCRYERFTQSSMSIVCFSPVSLNDFFWCKPYVWSLHVTLGTNVFILRFRSTSSSFLC